MKQVRKAVLPVAGLGTRFLPATIAQPKEMLPLVDKPLIQYGVEEAVASGITDIILVTSHGKEAIEEHFDVNPDLIRTLRERGKEDEARLVEEIGRLANVISVRQKEPLGLGHAVGCAADLVGDEPFAVLLPDDVIDSEVPCLRQLMEAREALGGGCVVATRAVHGPEIEHYGVLGVEPVEREGWKDKLHLVTALVEKPREADAPSPYTVVGRYILEPETFYLIAATEPGRGGEIQLTDALASFARHRQMYALEFEGVQHDAGSKIGFLEANIYFGLKHQEYGPRLREHLKKNLS